MTTFGLIGYPLGHSFSRGFFNDKFASEGISAEYLNFEIPSIEELPAVIAMHSQLAGFNVTIPYKQQVMKYLDDLSAEARAIGAVHVVKVIRNKNNYKLMGCNSVVIGFTNSISPLLESQHKRALILGTGGASKAVIYGLEQLGIECQYVSRTPREGVLGYEHITPELLEDYKIIVNCSPVGMHPHVDECPDIPYNSLNNSHLLYDLVYNPEETLFLKRGKAQGAKTKNGLEMLILQALAAWEIWHN